MTLHFTSAAFDSPSETGRKGKVLAVPITARTQRDVVVREFASSALGPACL